MHRTLRMGAASLILAGFMTTTATTSHAAVPSTNDVQRPTPAATSGTIQPLDCAGTTGARGCGPGWIWHDGWRGYGCYPC